MTVVVSRRERKKAAAKARILSAGMKLFSQRGLTYVTIDEIAEAADVGKGTIYNYFATKEDIVVAFMADLEARLSEQINSFSPGKQSVHRILADYILFHFRLKEPYHPFVRIFMAQMFIDTPRFVPYMLEIQTYTDPPLMALLSGLEKKQLLASDIDLPELMMSFKTMHLGLTALWAVEGPPFRQTKQTVRRQMKFLAEGISRKKA